MSDVMTRMTASEPGITNYDSPFILLVKLQIFKLMMWLFRTVWTLLMLLRERFSVTAIVKNWSGV